MVFDGESGDILWRRRGGALPIRIGRGDGLGVIGKLPEVIRDVHQFASPVEGGTTGQSPLYIEQARNARRRGVRQLTHGRANGSTAGNETHDVRNHVIAGAAERAVGGFLHVDQVRPAGQGGRGFGNGPNADKELGHAIKLPWARGRSASSRETIERAAQSHWQR